MKEPVFVKTGQEVRGKYEGKYFYEYAKFTEEEADTLTRNYQTMVEEIKIKIISNPFRYRYLKIPSIKVDVLNEIEIKKLVEKHLDEKVIGTFRKNNGNIRVFVEAPKFIEKKQEETEIPQFIEKKPEGPSELKFICDKCGEKFGKYVGLRTHQRFCKKEIENG